MNPKLGAPRHRRGSSLVEVVVVVAALVIIAGMILPALPGKGGRAHRIACVNSLKQVSTAFRLFANDYDGDFPYQVLSRSTNALPAPLPKATEFNRHDPRELWKVYLAAQNELSSPRILVCPKDDRFAATTFTNHPTDLKDRFDHPTHRLNALSYFYGLSAREDDPNQFVAGDRNLTTGGTDTAPPKDLLTGRVDLARFSQNPKDVGGQLRWGLGLHDKAGNVGFSDGHVEQLTSGKLREAVGVAISANQSSNQVLWLPNLPQAKP